MIRKTICFWLTIVLAVSCGAQSVGDSLLKGGGYYQKLGGCPKAGVSVLAIWRHPLSQLVHPDARAWRESRACSRVGFTI